MTQCSIDALFFALSDPTRRQIVERLNRGPLTVSEATAAFDMSQPACSKHVGVLEKAGLIHREISGRAHLLRLEPKSMRIATSWLAEFEWV